MSAQLKCQACGLALEPGSVFCRHCGQRVVEPISFADANLDDLLRASADFLRNSDHAIEACKEYLARFPDGPAVQTMRLVCVFVSARNASIQAAQGTTLEQHDPARHSLVNELAQFVVQSFPKVLSNGIVVDPRISEPAKRKTAIEFANVFCALNVRCLAPLFEQARRESEALLINGEMRAIVERKTVGSFYDDAGVYYAAYQQGDLQEALRGFRHLKSLNPFEAYSRNLIGAILLDEGKQIEALGEFLWGFYCDPGDTRLALNLIQELAAQDAWGALLQVAARHRAHQDDSLLELEKKVDAHAKLAEVCLAGLACKAAEVTPEDLGNSVRSFLDELPAMKVPWLDDLPKPAEVSVDVLAGARLFISYRHKDAPDLAHRLHQKLKTDYPTARVFLDEAAMVAGADFTDQLREEINRSDAFLLLIGPYWHTPEGRKRLHDPDDIVRREAAWALKNNKSIVPVLLDDAAVPDSASYPEALQSITMIHAHRLQAQTFDEDVVRLESALTRILQANKLATDTFDAAFDDAVKLMKEDSVAGQKKMAKILSPWEQNLPKFFHAKAQNAAGVPHSMVKLFGKWESEVRREREQIVLRFLLEDLPKSPCTVERTTYDANGRVVRTERFMGEWGRILDPDADVLLGFHFSLLPESGGPVEEWNIPLHRRVGDKFVGTDEFGNVFTSSNISPRNHGF